LPITRLICAATLSSQTVNGNFSGMAPGIVTIAISPSQVLQSQPDLLNFCTQPARSPSE
jgi:hypothetical protein